MKNYMAPLNIIYEIAECYSTHKSPIDTQFDVYVNKLFPLVSTAKYDGRVLFHRAANPVHHLLSSTEKL